MYRRVKRRLCATMNSTPARSQAPSIASASASELAIGFSHSTCRPAAAAASTCAWWANSGVAIMTASRSSRRSISR